MMITGGVFVSSRTSKDPRILNRMILKRTYYGHCIYYVNLGGLLPTINREGKPSEDLEVGNALWMGKTKLQVTLIGKLKSLYCSSLVTVEPIKTDAFCLHHIVKQFF